MADNNQTTGTANGTADNAANAGGFFGKISGWLKGTVGKGFSGVSTKVSETASKVGDKIEDAAGKISDKIPGANDLKEKASNAIEKGVSAIGEKTTELVEKGKDMVNKKVDGAQE